MRKKVNWILDADVRGFFDNLSHEWLAPRLGMLSEIFGHDFESVRCEGLVDGNINTTDPGAVHTEYAVTSAWRRPL
jgi:hypothetical protein